MSFPTLKPRPHRSTIHQQQPQFNPEIVLPQHVTRPHYQGREISVASTVVYIRLRAISVIAAIFAEIMGINSVIGMEIERSVKKMACVTILVALEAKNIAIEGKC